MDMTIIACTLLLIGGACLFLLYRNNCVAAVRRAFIDQPNWERDYRALPDYDQMLDNPRYWLLWTYADWKEWLDRQREKAINGH